MLIQRGIDERDAEWEVDAPTYRVFLWSRALAPPSIPRDQVGWRCEVVSIRDADVEDVLAWARDSAAARGTFSVYVEVDCDGHKGVVRLAGTDPTRR